MPYLANKNSGHPYCIHYGRVTKCRHTVGGADLQTIALLGCPYVVYKDGPENIFFLYWTGQNSLDGPYWTVLIFLARPYIRPLKFEKNVKTLSQMQFLWFLPTDTPFTSFSCSPVSFFV